MRCVLLWTPVYRRKWSYRSRKIWSNKPGQGQPWFTPTASGIQESTLITTQMLKNTKYTHSVPATEVHNSIKGCRHWNLAMKITSHGFIFVILLTQPSYTSCTKSVPRNFSLMNETKLVTTETGGRLHNLFRRKHFLILKWILKG